MDRSESLLKGELKCTAVALCSALTQGQDFPKFPGWLLHNGQTDRKDGQTGHKEGWTDRMQQVEGIIWLKQIRIVEGASSMIPTIGLGIGAKSKEQISSLLAILCSQF